MEPAGPLPAIMRLWISLDDARWCLVKREASMGINGTFLRSAVWMLSEVLWDGLYLYEVWIDETYFSVFV